VIAAVVDQDLVPMERWLGMRNAEAVGVVLRPTWQRRPASRPVAISS